MAIFRSLQVSFWQDEFVIELTPEEKFFYVYLMTNSKSTQCGIFSISKRLIEMETGYNRDTIDKLIIRFEGYGKIMYSVATKEIMVVNWIKYNFINSKNTIMCINKELKGVKEKTFIKRFYEKCKEYSYPIDSIFADIDVNEEKSCEKQGISCGEEGACKGLGEKEKEIKKEITTTKREDGAANFKEVIDFFNNNIHLITPHEHQVLSDWSECVENQVVLLAVKEAVENNVRKIKYINGILNNWFNLGLITGDRVQKYKRETKPYIDKDKQQTMPNAAAYEYVD